MLNFNSRFVRDLPIAVRRRQNQVLRPFGTTAAPEQYRAECRRRRAHAWQAGRTFLQASARHRRCRHRRPVAAEDAPRRNLHSSKNPWRDQRTWRSRRHCAVWPATVALRKRPQSQLKRSPPVVAAMVARKRGQSQLAHWPLVMAVMAAPRLARSQLARSPLVVAPMVARKRAQSQLARSPPVAQLERSRLLMAAIVARSHSGWTRSTRSPHPKRAQGHPRLISKARARG